jgi:hypothetical protein
MWNSLRGPLVVLCSALIAAGVLIAPAFAQKPWLRTLSRHYQLDATMGTKCTICHQLKEKEEPSSKNLNAYGKDIAAQEVMKPILGKDEKYAFSNDELALVVKAAEALNDKDSDGDGATNKEEFDLSTFPGDPNSKPDPKKLEAYRKAHPKK